MTWISTLKWIMDMCGKYRAVMNLKSWLQVYMNLTLRLHISQNSPKKTYRTCSVPALWWLDGNISLLHLFIHWEGKCITWSTYGGQRTSYSSTDSFLLPCRSQGLTEFKSSALTRIFNQRSPSLAPQPDSGALWWPYNQDSSRSLFSKLYNVWNSLL